MYALGVNLSRHCSACLLRDRGAPIAAVEAWLTGHPGNNPLEPFGRSDVSMPERSIDYCLLNAGISYVDLDVIVFCGAVPPTARTTRKLSVAECVLRLPFSPQSRMLTMDTAPAHAYGAYYRSGYDEAAIVVVSRSDSAAAVYDSAAAVYGSTPHAVISPLEQAEIFSASEGVIVDAARASSDGLAALSKKQSLEDIVLDLSVLALQRTGYDRLCIAGNHMLDAQAGIRIRNTLSVREVFVQPVVDDGTALGAALYGWNHEQSPSLCD